MHITRKTLRRGSARGPAARQDGPSRLDVWLVRGSHLAQVGLLVFTVATLFYTVIPLYKTAALEEQIARREAELKGLETRLSEAASALAEANAKTYKRDRAELVRRFAFEAPYCSGLFARDRKAEDPNDRPEKGASALKFDVDACAKDALARLSPGRVLSHADNGRLSAYVEGGLKALAERRASIQREVDDLPKKTSVELREIAPPGYFALRAEREMKALEAAGLLRINPGDERRRAVERATDRLDDLFRKEVHDFFHRVRSIEWGEADAPSAQQDSVGTASEKS